MRVLRPQTLVGVTVTTVFAGPVPIAHSCNNPPDEPVRNAVLLQEAHDPCLARSIRRGQLLPGGEVEEAVCNPGGQQVFAIRAERILAATVNRDRPLLLRPGCSTQGPEFHCWRTSRRVAPFTGALVMTRVPSGANTGPWRYPNPCS